MKIETAWFGSGHPAHGETCPECYARPGKACTTAQTNGGRVALTGMHALRVKAANERAKEAA